MISDNRSRILLFTCAATLARIPDSEVPGGPDILAGGSQDICGIIDSQGREEVP